MMDLLKKMVEDFNSYSELVALNYEMMKEGKHSETTLQWNRGNLNRIEEYMITVAAELGVEVGYECGDHIFGYDDWKRTLTYKTAVINQTAETPCGGVAENCPIRLDNIAVKSTEDFPENFFRKNLDKNDLKWYNKIIEIKQIRTPDEATSANYGQ